MMNEEMTGMAAPATEAPMAEEPAIQNELTVDAMKSNYEAMDADRQMAIKEIMNDAVAQLFDELTGQSVMSEFAMTINGDEEEPAPTGEGMMAPTEEPMAEAPEEPMPTEEEEATPPV